CRLAWLGNGPEAPRLAAGRGVVSGEESADTHVAAGHAPDDQVAGHQRGRRPAVWAWTLRHRDIPHQAAGKAVQADKVRVIGDIENAVEIGRASCRERV